MFYLPIPPMPFLGMGVTTPVALPVGTVVAFAEKFPHVPQIPLQTIQLTLKH